MVERTAIMLSLFVLTLALGLAAPKLQESAFTGKREYVYRYMVQTVSGLPGASRTYSGVKVVANVRLQFITTSVVVAQLEDVQLFTMNDAITRQNPIREQLDPEVMMRFYNPEIHAVLAEPFTFNYLNGHVVNVKTPELEPYWSVNIKRGVLSMLEVNLNQRFTPIKQRANSPMYEAYETSASGMCRTLYTVEEPEMNSDIPKEVIVVSKTRNFTDCPRRPVWFKSTFNVEACPDRGACLGVSEGAQVRYTLKGSRERFVILSAIAESYVSVHPHSAESGHVSTVVNQTLYFVDANDMKDSTIMAKMATKNMMERYIISFIPEEMIDSQFPFANELRMPMSMDELRFTEKAEIVNVLRTAAQSIIGPEVLTVGARFPVMAVNKMRLANETVLSEIWSDYAIPQTTESEEDVAMRKVVWQAMAATGTCMSGNIILDSCASRKLPPVECAGLINIMSLVNQPNSTFLDKLITVATALGDGEDPQLVRALWLGIGAVTNKMIRAEKHELRDLNRHVTVMTAIMKHEQDQVARLELVVLRTHLLNKYQSLAKMYTDVRIRIVTLIRVQLSKAGSDVKIMALKTAENAELPELIPVCLAFIHDLEQPEFVRFSAVSALTRMAKWAPVVVTESLLPVFLRTTDSAVIRLAAFRAILKATPTRQILEMFARHVTREPDLQVSSYIYSTLETSSNTTHPCDQGLAKEFGRALQYTPTIKPGPQYSAVKLWENFNIYGKYGVRGGMGGGISYFGSNSSLIPTFAQTFLRSYMFGANVHILDVSVYTEELRSAIEKLVGPDGIFTNRKSILDVFSPRMRRSVDTHANIEEIVQKLKIKSRTMPVPKGILSIKLFDYEMRYFTLDEALQRLATAGKLSISYKENAAGILIPLDFHQPLYLGDVVMLFPTESGIPVTAKLTATANVMVKGATEVKVSPSLFSSRRQSAPFEVTASYKLNPSAVMEVNGYVAVLPFNKWVGAGFTLRTKVAAPLIGNFTVNLRKMKIIAAIVPPVQEEPLVEIESFPLTFQTLYNAKENEKVVEIAEGGKIIESIYEYGNDTLGLNMVCRIKRASQYGNPIVPLYPLNGRTVVQLFVKPGPSPPDAIVAQAQFTTGSPIKPASSTSYGASPSCDCIMGRLTLCVVACADEDVTEPEVVETGSSLEDFPDLMAKDVTFTELKSKLQAKLGDSLRLSPVGHKWGMVATIDASTPVVKRKLQVEALWQSVNNQEMHQLVFRVVQTPIPSYSQPWEMVAHAMMQYPNRVINPVMLMNPGYQMEVKRDLQFLAQSMEHRPVLSHINNTVITLLRRNLQHLTGSLRANDLLRTFALQLFAKSNSTEVKTLAPIWRRLILLNNWVDTVWHRSIDPIFLIKHVDSLVTTIVDIEKIQLSLVEKLQELRAMTSTSVLYPRVIEYLLDEHCGMLITVTKVLFRASKIAIVPHAETLYAKGNFLLSSLHEEILRYSDVLGILPPVPEMLDPALKKIWPNLAKMSAIQMNTLKHILMAQKTHKFPSMQIVIDAIGMVKEILPTIYTATKETRKIDLTIVPVFSKLAIQHSMIFRSLELLIERVEVPSLSKKDNLVHVLRALKSQTSAFAMSGAIFIKYHSELTTIAPIASERDLTTLRQLQMFQAALGAEMSRVVSLGMYLTPYANNLEGPEQVFVVADNIMTSTKKLIKRMSSVIDEIVSTNVDPNIHIYEKTLAVVFYASSVVKELKVFITSSVVFNAQISRSIEVIRECEKILVEIEELEIVVTKTFEKIWNSASHTDVTSMPMSKDLLKIILSVTAAKQKEVRKEVEQWTSLAATQNILPWLTVTLETCRGLQSKIDWIQLWGMNLGPMAPLFAKVIGMQQELLKKIRVLVTASQTKLDNPVAISLDLDDIQGQLTKVLKIGSVEMVHTDQPTNVPLPNWKKIPTYPGAPKYQVPQPIKPKDTSFANNPFIKMDATYLPLSMTIFANVSFGPVGSTPKTIIMKGYATKSFEQLLWESKQLDPLMTDPGLEDSVARVEAEAIYDMQDNPVFRQINSLNHVQLTWTYIPNEIPEWFKFKVINGVSMFTSAHRWQTTFSPPVKQTLGIIHLVTEAKFDGPSVDWFLMTPNTTIAVTGVSTSTSSMYPLAIVAAALKPPTLRRLALTPYVGPYIPTVCKLAFENIRTFDGVEYTLPDVGNCPMVLAMDCSPDKTFAITMRSETGTYKKKILEIMAEGKTMTVRATGTGVSIAVDGNPITVSHVQPFYWQKTVSYGKLAVAIKIVQERYYTIELPLLGLTVRTDGNFVEIKGSTLFKMKTCGLCSNMDGQQRHEFQAADGRIFNTPEHFVSSYIIRGPTCPSRVFRKVGGIGKLPLHEISCVSRPMTMIKYRKRQKKVCFAMRPIPQCPHTCRVEDVEKVKMPVVCVPIGSQDALAIQEKIDVNGFVDLSDRTRTSRMNLLKHVSCRK